MRYRRAWTPGGCFFFTVVTHNRLPVFDSHRRVAILRHAFRRIRARYPFTLDAAVILPDHLHCIWTLPADDADFAIRWQRIKTEVSRSLRKAEGIQPVWQPRFWEHRLRDGQDWRNHVDYIHYNPVKHGHAPTPVEWPWSSVHWFIRDGRLEPEWGSTPIDLPGQVGNE